MGNRTFRYAVLAAAALAYLLVMAGGAVRAAGAGDAAALWILAYRTLAAMVLGAAGVAAFGAGRALQRVGYAVAAGLGGLVTLGAVALVDSFTGAVGSGSLSAVHPSVAAAFVASWLAATVFIGGEQPYHSRLSMFRSQWQVPLYAALATYAVVFLGSYIKSLGPAAACAGGWPLCTGTADAGVLAIHLLHRAAAALAGGLLLYTLAFVWRKHQNRPALLVL
ncbi:MAG TPA: hypothetical protein VD902_17940, partial [Symbiobacteriaceae bacterium]|nr:hypothetical protein [Symbiobacteriaceae bacterium]